LFLIELIIFGIYFVSISIDLFGYPGEYIHFSFFNISLSNIIIISLSFPKGVAQPGIQPVFCFNSSGDARETLFPRIFLINQNQFFYLQ